MNAHTHLVLGTLSFVNPLKVVVRSSDFSTIGNIQIFQRCFKSEDKIFWSQRFETFIFTSGGKFGLIRNPSIGPPSPKKKKQQKIK